VLLLFYKLTFTDDTSSTITVPVVATVAVVGTGFLLVVVVVVVAIVINCKRYTKLFFNKQNSMTLL